MIKIDRFTLQLPVGFEDRAKGIMPLIAQELAAAPVNVNKQIDRIRVLDLEVNPIATDKQAAVAIAAAVLGGIESQRTTKGMV